MAISFNSENHIKNNIDMDNLPNHIGIIMDGNGRWAKKRSLPRTAGHKAGSNVLKTLALDADKIGIKNLTVYAFSTENWTRPKAEVDYLMNLIREFIKSYINDKTKNNLKMNVIGDISKFPEDIVNDILELKTSTMNNSGTCLHIALNYGGRDDIMRGMKNVFADILNEEINIDDLTEELFSSYLDTKSINDPELIIRTSGEIRTSNFLLWQSAYSEFYFTDKFWPDFRKSDLLEAISDYQNRERRFGGRNEE